VLLTAYVPVFLLGYSIQLMLALIVPVTLAYLPFGSISPSVRRMFHGIIWPEYWLQEGNTVCISTSVLLKMRSIFCNDVLNNWLVLMTFGLCSPVLAVAIVCSVLLKMSLWMLLIGRFTSHVLHADGAADMGADVTTSPPMADAVSTASANTAAAPPSVPVAPICSLVKVSKVSDEVKLCVLTALADSHIPLIEVLRGSFWRLVWCSTFFVAIIGWDMATDEVGWLQSVWVPLVAIGFALLLRCVAYWINSWHRSTSQGSAEDPPAALPKYRESTVVGVSQQNPLHTVDDDIL
jgi:hypothetical protein